MYFNIIGVLCIEINARMAVSSSFLKVFAQAELEESIIPIIEGQTIVGRGQDCGTGLIPSKGLSRHHVEILVDGSEHFIKDLGSRNKTYRFKHQLRPHVYYELGNNTELHLANVKCQYIIAGLGLENPTTAHLAAAEGEKHLNGDEQTLGLEDSDQSTVNGGDGEEMVEKDEAVCRNDIEPTQPYFAGGTGEEEHIEYENTVPYKEEGSDNDEDISSIHSSPILGGKPTSINQQGTQGIKAGGHRVSFGPAVCSAEEEDTDSQDDAGSSSHAPLADTSLAVSTSDAVDKSAETSVSKHAFELDSSINGQTIPVVGTSYDGQTVPVVDTSFDGQTIPVVDTSFDGQTIPVVGTSYDGQTIPVVDTSFDGQTIPVVDTSFDGQTIPVVDTSFDGQTIPVVGTSYDGQAVPVGHGCTIPDDNRTTTSQYKGCDEQEGKKSDEWGKQVGSLEQQTALFGQTVAYDLVDNTGEPTVAYNLAIDETEEDSKDGKDISCVLFSEQESSPLVQDVPVVPTQCNIRNVDSQHKGVCQDQKDGNPKDQKDGSPKDQKDGSPKDQKDGNPKDQKDGSPKDQKDGSPKDQKDGSPKDQKDGSPKDQKDGSPKDQKDGNPKDQKDGSPKDQKDGSPKDQKDGNPKDQKDGSPKDQKDTSLIPQQANSQDSSPVPVEANSSTDVADLKGAEMGVQDDSSDDFTSLIPSVARGRYSKQKVNTLLKERGKAARRKGSKAAGSSDEEVKNGSSVQPSLVDKGRRGKKASVKVSSSVAEPDESMVEQPTVVAEPSLVDKGRRGKKASVKASSSVAEPDESKVEQPTVVAEPSLVDKGRRGKKASVKASSSVAEPDESMVEQSTVVAEPSLVDKGRRGKKASVKASSSVAEPDESMVEQPTVVAEPSLLDKGRRGKKASVKASSSVAEPDESKVEQPTVVAEPSLVDKGRRGKKASVKVSSSVAEPDESKVEQPTVVAEPSLVDKGRRGKKASVKVSSSVAEPDESKVEQPTAEPSLVDGFLQESGPVAETSKVTTGEHAEVVEGSKQSELKSPQLEGDVNKSLNERSTDDKSSPPPSSSSSTCSLVPSVSGSSKGSHTSARLPARAKATPRRSVKPSLNLEGTPSLRPKCSVETEKPRVLFTGIVYQEGEQIVKDMGGQLVESVYECTHLVTDKMVRTVKLLCCLSRGCHIVNSRWLDQCQQQGIFLPAEGFLLKDRTAERQHNFSLQRSLHQARQCKLLDGYKIYLTPNVVPDRASLSDIIKCSGGQLLDALPTVKDDRTLVVSCEQDLSTCKAALEAGLGLYTPELILSGALRQELDVNTNMLSQPATPSTTGVKRKAEPSEEATTKRRRK